MSAETAEKKTHRPAVYFAYGGREMDYLKSRDRKLGEAIDRIGFITWQTEPDLFKAVVYSIVAQQISGKAAETVYNRLSALVGELTPKSLTSMDAERIQKCGMSMKKATNILDFARKVHTGEFDIAALSSLSDDEVVARLSSLRGIGVWTAEMLLLFTLQHPDVLSRLDFGILRGMRMVYRHRKITKEMFERCRRRLSPCGSVASLYFWKVAGGAILGLTDPAVSRKAKSKKEEKT